MVTAAYVSRKRRVLTILNRYFPQRLFSFKNLLNSPIIDWNGKKVVISFDNIHNIFYQIMLIKQKKTEKLYAIIFLSHIIL